MKKSWAVWILLAFGAWAIGSWPVTTQVGVNYEVSAHRITLFEKAVDFLSRELQIRRLTVEICKGASTDEEKLLALFSWVTEQIRPVPPGFPVVDDHLLNVVIRGSGAADQRTEVFALLAGTAGYPSGLCNLWARGSGTPLIVALTQVKGRVFLFDVNNHLVFRNAQGRLADLKELSADSVLVSQAAGGLSPHGIPYDRYLAGLDTRSVCLRRMEAQRPLARLRQEALRLLKGP